MSNPVHLAAKKSASAKTPIAVAKVATAATLAMFKDKSKKKDGNGRDNAIAEIKLIKQTGPNCGMFAAAMAIGSAVIRVAGSTLSVSLAERAELTIRIAELLEKTAKENGRSSSGEMFDADNLTEAINLISEDESIKDNMRKKTSSSKIPLEKILIAKTVTFTSETQLKEILTVAQERGVRVLIPYFAGTKVEPFVFTSATVGEKAPAEQMSRAHWAVVDTINKDKVSLKEGNGKTVGSYELESLFDSNQSLGDLFSWNSFIAGTICKVAKKYKKEVAARKEKLRDPAKDTLKDTFPSEVTDDMNEKVNLRGKLILLGRAAAAAATPATTSGSAP